MARGLLNPTGGNGATIRSARHWATVCNETLNVSRRARTREIRSLCRGTLVFRMVWGRWGLLLAFPIMAIVNIVFNEIEHRKPVVLLMGN